MTKTITKQVKDLTFKDLYEICSKEDDCSLHCPLCNADICHGSYSHIYIFERGAECADTVITFETNNDEYVEDEVTSQINTESHERKNYLWIYDGCDDVEVISLTEGQVRLFNYIANYTDIGILKEFTCKEI